MGIAFGGNEESKDTEFRLPQTQHEWLDMFVLIKQHLYMRREAIEERELKYGKMTTHDESMFNEGWDACRKAVNRAMSFFVRP